VSLRTLALGAAAAGLAALAAQPALADNAPASAQACFLASNWQGWKSPSPSVIYLRIGINQIYRLDLSAPSSELQDPDVHLINKVRGSDWICNPLDLDLKLADDHGAMREPLFVKSITRLTPDEVAAIPKEFKP
jgi:hypothetical protein